ncbi:MAG: purine-binding chemotaxis protein CheW [Myxococcales bacterium]|nr:purine-binding chemotaxis protein CheW [Myxococcales bacterium]
MVQLCTFRVGAQQYALDIMRIQEVLQPPEVTPVPDAPPFFEGMVNLRGSLVPVVDLRRRLGAMAPSAPPKRKLLVCAFGQRRVGLLVDGVTSVLTVGRDELKPAPPLLAPGAHPFVVGACASASGLTLLLNLKSVLAPGPAGQAPRGTP